MFWRKRNRKKINKGQEKMGKKDQKERIEEVKSEGQFWFDQVEKMNSLKGN